MSWNRADSSTMPARPSMRAEITAPGSPALGTAPHVLALGVIEELDLAVLATLSATRWRMSAP